MYFYLSSLDDDQKSIHDVESSLIDAKRWIGKKDFKKGLFNGSKSHTNTHIHDNYNGNWHHFVSNDNK